MKRRPLGRHHGIHNPAIWHRPVLDGSDDLAYRTAKSEYKEAARAAGDHGVRLALEPLNPILMNVDTFICSLVEAPRMVEAVDHPAFGKQAFEKVWQRACA